MKKIYYWSPYVGKVATIKAVINSAYSLSKYSKNKYLPVIINSCGEWNNFKNEFTSKKINLIDLQKKFKINIKINGFLKSRIEYLKVFFACYFSLKNLIKTEKPSFLIVHLITSLPLILYIFNNFETKLIIRISGKVKLNFFRKLLWKINSKNIHLITCPTKQSLLEINNLKIISENKLIFLPDPAIDIIEINKKTKNLNFDLKEKYFLSVGRLTKQKNHLLLIKAFANLKDELKKTKLIIIGDGELKNEYLKNIDQLNLQDKIYLIGHKENVFSYMKNSLGIISTSLWEDPGFVMIEAAACNTFIISSNCPSGPEEFVGKKNGILFKNNNLNDLQENIKKYLIMHESDIFKMKIRAKKKSLNFTKFRHYKILSNFLN